MNLIENETVQSTAYGTLRFHSAIRCISQQNTHLYRAEDTERKNFYLKMSKCIFWLLLLLFSNLVHMQKPINHSPSLPDRSAELNCESYFNAASYGILSMSRCRPCTNWKMPQIPTRKNSTFLTFADLTIADDLQSISIMLEIRWI